MANADNELVFKISGRLDDINKSLEANFRYQLITVVLCYLFLKGVIPGKQPFEFFGIPFNKELMSVAFPAVLLYLVSKMAVLLMLFLELSENFFTELAKTEKDAENYSLLRSFRSNSIFLAIPLTHFTYKGNKRSKAFMTFCSSLLYAFPGLNIALVFCTIMKYQNFEIWLPFTIVAIVALAGLFWEYYHNPVTGKYRYFLLVGYGIAIVAFVILKFMLK